MPCQEVCLFFERLHHEQCRFMCVDIVFEASLHIHAMPGDLCFERAHLRRCRYVCWHCMFLVQYSISMPCQVICLCFRTIKKLKACWSSTRLGGWTELRAHWSFLFLEKVRFSTGHDSIDHVCLWWIYEFQQETRNLWIWLFRNHLRDSIDHECNLWCVSQIFRHKRSLNHRFSWGNPNSCQMGTSEFRILSLTCIIFLTLLKQFKKLWFSYLR